MISINEMVKSIKIVWVKRLNNNITAKWKTLSWFFLGIKKNNCSLNWVIITYQAKYLFHSTFNFLSSGLILFVRSQKTKKKSLKNTFFNNYNICIEKTYKACRESYKSWNCVFKGYNE